VLRVKGKDISRHQFLLTKQTSVISSQETDNTRRIRRRMGKTLKASDIPAKRFEINELFTPSTPVAVAELFAGRSGQMIRIIDTIAERGRHAILFGERGVGKTSLVQVVPFIVPGRRDRVRYCRVQAFPTDTFHSVATKIFKNIKFAADIGDGSHIYDVSETISNQIGPDEIVNEFGRFTPNEVPIVVIDEFNEITDLDTPVLIANTIKALSDSGINATIIIVGVADNVSQLISNHESIQRCTEQIMIPRMTKEELLEVLDKRLKQLGFTISGDAKWKIVNLAKGLPAYVHGLGKHACLNAIIPAGRLHLEEGDVDAAIDVLIASSNQFFKDAYEAATRSNQPCNLLRHELMACALAKADDSGYFTPVAVKEPLSAILGRHVEIANFQNHLKAFIDPKRKGVLQRDGEPRAYRFRFKEPAMQPFVIMKGFMEGIIDADAKLALSSPEEPDLFAT
jgi:Cdc6-like AAA superfamily ATPase